MKSTARRRRRRRRHRRSLQITLEDSNILPLVGYLPGRCWLMVTNELEVSSALSWSSRSDILDHDYDKGFPFGILSKSYHSFWIIIIIIIPRRYLLEIPDLL